MMAVERLKRTRREQPGNTVKAGKMSVKDDLATTVVEGWSWRRHAEQELRPACGSINPLKKMVARVAGAFDGACVSGAEARTATLAHIYKNLQFAGKDEAHDMLQGWPLICLVDPVQSRMPFLTSAEATALS